MIIIHKLPLILCLFGLSFSAMADSPTNEELDPKLVEHFSKQCFQNWQQLDWTLGSSQTLAKDYQPFSDGIKKVCQAKVELFLEGYEVEPFIEADSQEDTSKLVFMPDVMTIKQTYLNGLPPLRVL